MTWFKRAMSIAIFKCDYLAGLRICELHSVAVPDWQALCKLHLAEQGKTSTRDG